MLNTRVSLGTYEFLIELTYCPRFVLWKILSVFWFFFFFTSCIYNLFTRCSGRNWNERFGWKVFFIYIGMPTGIRNMCISINYSYFYIFYFSLSFLFSFCFIICGTLRNCKHAFFFPSFGLLWAILFDRTHKHSLPLYPHSLLFFSWYCCYSPSPSLAVISRCVSVSVYKLNEASDVSQSTATFEIILKNATMLPNSTSSHSLSLPLSLSMFLSLSLVLLFIYISSCSVRIFSLFWPDTLWGRNLLKLSKFNEISLVARHKMRYIF